jgi:alkylhydroperoxidase family enzyme
MQTLTNTNRESALIHPQAPADDEEKVAAILGAIEERLGFVPDGLRLYSISPPLLESFVSNIGYFNSGGTELPPTLTAMIRYQISWNSGCSFCIDMNEGFLTSMGVDLDSIRASRNNPDAAPFDEKQKALLKLAIKSVNSPEDVSKTDLDEMRRWGWNDRSIFDAVVQAANNRAFNYVLRTFNIEHQGSLA